MGKAARALSHPNAARNIAQLAAQLAGKLGEKAQDAAFGA
jgi:hypothetical protein